MYMYINVSYLQLTLKLSNAQKCDISIHLENKSDLRRND